MPLKSPIEYKAAWEIELIRRACQIVSAALSRLREMVRPGVTTRELDWAAEEAIRAQGASPAFKGYRDYPYSLCTSVNEEVVHGLPSERRLESGDIVSLDLGAVVDGYYGDGAVTVPVGEVSPDVFRLLQVTEEALERGIAVVQPGNRVGDISHTIQECVEQAGYSVVRTFVGHGIGKTLHEEPQVPNFGAPGCGVVLKPGMTLAIEPMVNAGGPEVMVLDDRWTAVTRDGTLSAHFEHTVAVTETGHDVLTRR